MVQNIHPQSRAGRLRVELFHEGHVCEHWHVYAKKATLGSGPQSTLRLRGVPDLLPVHITLYTDDGVLTVMAADGATMLSNGRPAVFVVPRPTDVLTIGRVDLRVSWLPTSPAPNRPTPDNSTAVVVEVPGGRRRTLSLRPGRLVIGAGRARVRLRFDGVEDRHAELVTSGGGVTIRALDGRVVRNGLPTRECKLGAADIIELGPIRLWKVAPPAPVRETYELHIPRHRLRNGVSVQADEDDADPETVRMPSMQSMFEDTAPPTVRVVVPAPALVTPTPAATVRVEPLKPVPTPPPAEPPRLPPLAPVRRPLRRLSDRALAGATVALLALIGVLLVALAS